MATFFSKCHILFPSHINHGQSKIQIHWQKHEAIPKLKIIISMDLWRFCIRQQIRKLRFWIWIKVTEISIYFVFHPSISESQSVIFSLLFLAFSWFSVFPWASLIRDKTFLETIRWTFWHRLSAIQIRVNQHLDSFRVLWIGIHAKVEWIRIW